MGVGCPHSTPVGNNPIVYREPVVWVYRVQVVVGTIFDDQKDGCTNFCPDGVVVYAVRTQLINTVREVFIFLFLIFNAIVTDEC